MNTPFLFKGAVCRFWRHLAVDVANCNHRLNPLFAPPFKGAFTPDANEANNSRVVGRLNIEFTRFIRT